ncbi:hypothetical protein Syun_011807 [Stephania yunnanensis]|uniref:Uncharacterized protein n=1 Tax=Stephania yunnanensis TaxID=152371 RepID=A0AAP0JYB2_9MAGN
MAGQGEANVVRGVDRGVPAVLALDSDLQVARVPPDRSHGGITSESCSFRSITFIGAKEAKSNCNRRGTMMRMQRKSSTPLSVVTVTEIPPEGLKGLGTKVIDEDDEKIGLQDKIQLVPIDLWKRPAWYKEKVYPKNKVDDDLKQGVPGAIPIPPDDAEKEKVIALHFGS